MKVSLEQKWWNADQFRTVVKHSSNLKGEKENEKTNPQCELDPRQKLMKSKITSRWIDQFSMVILFLPTLLMSNKILANREVRLSTDVLRITDFSMALDSTWDSKSFKGNTHYERVRFQGNGWALKAVAMNSASSLGKRLRINPEEFPILRWRWRVEGLPTDGDETQRGGDDAAARILLVFKDGNVPWKFNSLCYLWANRLAKGASADNVLSSRVKMVAVRSGTAELGMWKTEERDYLADYERLFGKRPTKLVGIAIMTDTDNTGSEAIAFYDFIELRASD